MYYLKVKDWFYSIKCENPYCDKILQYHENEEEKHSNIDNVITSITCPFCGEKTFTSMKYNNSNSYNYDKIREVSFM